MLKSVKILYRCISKMTLFCIGCVSALYPFCIHCICVPYGLFVVRVSMLSCKMYRLDVRIVVCKKYYVFEKELKKCHMIWRRVSKSWREWLKYFTVCVANDLKYWMAETYFDRRKSKTRVFWLLFCSLPRRACEYL